MEIKYNIWLHELFVDKKVNIWKDIETKKNRNKSDVLINMYCKQSVARSLDYNVQSDAYEFFTNYFFLILRNVNKFLSRAAPTKNWDEKQLRWKKEK